MLKTEVFHLNVLYNARSIKILERPVKNRRLVYLQFEMNGQNFTAAVLPATTYVTVSPVH